VKEETLARIKARAMAAAARHAEDSADDDD